MEGQKKISIGVQYGLIAGILYCILLFLKYNFFSSNPLTFAIFTFPAYLLIVVFFFLSGYAKKKSQGGFIEMKEVFKTILITIVIAEIFYIVFNFIYLKFIDPTFFKKFAESIKSLMEKQGATDEQIEQQLQSFEATNSQISSPINNLKGLGMWIVIDSIFGLIFALILKKSKDVFEPRNTLQ